MTKKRILSLCLTVVLVLSMLVFAGCGSKEKKEEAPKPTNTQELLDAYKKASEDVENYSLAGKGTMEIKAAAQGMEMSIVVLTPSPIFVQADSLSLFTINAETWGIIAAAIAEENAMGILERTCAFPEKIPQWAVVTT